MNNENFVTEEEIQKAMEDLNEEMITSDSKIEELIKGDSDEEDDDEKAPTNAKVEGEDSSDEDEGEDEDDGEYKAVKGKKGMFMKAGKMYKKEGDEYSEVEMKKGDDSETLEEIASDEEFEKALEISPVVARLNETLESVEAISAKKFGSVGTILKGLSEQMNDINQKLDAISNRSEGRKSASAGVASRGVERFEKAEGEEGDSKTVSISKERNKVLDIMDGLTFAKGFDDEMSKAMGYYEANGTVNTQVSVRIEKETGYRLVQ